MDINYKSPSTKLPIFNQRIYNKESLVYNILKNFIIFAVISYLLTLQKYVTPNKSPFLLTH